jgi:hypothetical protein
LIRRIFQDLPETLQDASVEVAIRAAWTIGDPTERSSYLSRLSLKLQEASKERILRAALEAAEEIAAPEKCALRAAGEQCARAASRVVGFGLITACCHGACG